MRVRESRGPWLWPLAAIIIGVLLLFDNFLLLGDFNVTRLWPLLLVVIGAQILLRGDIALDTEARTFGITRGSVESANMEISAGGIDVELHALQKEGRLIAGQFAHNSRPSLDVVENHAELILDRSRVPWFSNADWKLALARDLPWGVYSTSHLGQINADLSGLIVQDAMIATGLGDIRLVCPDEVLESIRVRSTLGNIHIMVPPGQPATITVAGGRMFKTHYDETRYDVLEAGVYTARDTDEDAAPVEILVSGVFGDAYLG